MSEQAPFQFDDGKSPDALRTIGEVAQALGIRQHVLRYWEQQFPMLSPVKRSGGRRYYRPEDVALIARIDRLVHREGYTLRGARRAIETGGEEEAPARKQPQTSVQDGDDDRPIGSDLSGLIEVRARLARALEADDAGA